MPGKSLALAAIGFPLECPTCKAKAGMPFRALTSPDAVQVDLRCRECRYEWRFEMPVKADALPEETNP